MTSKIEVYIFGAQFEDYCLIISSLARHKSYKCLSFVNSIVFEKKNTIIQLTKDGLEIGMKTHLTPHPIPQNIQTVMNKQEHFKDR